MSKGVLLANLGSPDSPSVPDVRRYLREFLMDRRVLDVNWFLRFCIVYFAILPSRPKQSARAYQSIWTPQGSPLIVSSRAIQAKLQEKTSLQVELAMRYQNPSIPDAIRRLSEKGVDQLFLVPLFPHYAMSSYETAVVRVKEVAAAIAPHRSAVASSARLSASETRGRGVRAPGAQMTIEVQPPYYDRPDYIAALASSARGHLERGYDHLLFSFHGLPERQIRKSDPTGCHCLMTDNCCETPSPAHATCYRAQCFKTVAAFVAKAGVPKEKYSVAFQSRLGRTPWLRPFTDQELVRLPGQGIRRLLVICPAFVSDCLETLEEIGIRGRETFLQAGGKEFAPIPCLNEHPLWVEALANMVRGFAGKGS